MFSFLKRKIRPEAGTAGLEGGGGPYQTFLGGAYRQHASADRDRYTALAVEAFPDFGGRIDCFGIDWLGNQFATDLARVVGGRPQILLLEPGTGEVLELPATMDTFHDGLLVQEPDAVAAHEFFKRWLAAGGAVPAYGECVGYRKPLYLGGADDIANLEIIDLEVYWSISAQLLAKLRGLPAGTSVGRVTLDD
ncbi:T6SS immunity protein Tdi1 domain-containing protein [Longimicrobium terrae]|uniref:T6SS immunity protein Tdi1 C-terminal domain-containing protein n=1 Tax=Longimicrobium terrae TaxID=1639882 RepID=A0A841H4F8_9BACT|nr:T6SS immunity protein Tdi1 domain-containing protein [Longimicrobium terrae]MBB4638618.1 hypothetical protein [Longimicrobium terrae]MBB6072858.1 hypothetical protein [Longimicrobium terrae]NNC31475.1 DUF1851 domain-containing protein [Longimicrobium terrae]